MKVIRLFIYLILVLVGAFVLFLIYASVDDYKPVQVELQRDNDQVPALSDSSDLKLVNWNLGYAGLDASMDFFYDGGQQMRPSEEGVINNMKGIVNLLNLFVKVKLALLQISKYLFLFSFFYCPLICCPNCFVISVK